MFTFRLLRTFAILVVLSLLVALLAACGATSNDLYVPDLLSQADQYNGQEITVAGAYVRPAADPSQTVLALGVSTRDNGLDAEPLGDPVWLEGFPEADIKDELHQPGDSIYGFVRVTGRFESGGGFGPESRYAHRIVVSSAEAIEQVRRQEQRITDAPLGEGKVSLFALTDNPAQYNGQEVTTQGYYFWNSVIFVLAEGISVEEDGSSPQPIGRQIWMEGFPPDVSGALNLGPNNSYVWGLVEVTGQFQGGGSYGKDGAYNGFLQVTSARALEGAQE